ncbi:single-stranded DNA-binding protein [Streptomyces sp. URMC 124]|uniref:single-stranded DNA-binding protein n=1 Tax=Streptomyces sp. URMC 124 TaxID=3423405 RepID=UPI003F1C743D
MNETLVTVVGNVATEPDYREAANGSPSSRFRLAATVRRWDRSKEEWSDAHTSFYTVWAWRALAGNVVASLGVGEPVVVQGKLRIREEEREGKRWVSAEIDAVSVGHDLSRGTSVFRRAPSARPLPAESSVPPAGTETGPVTGPVTGPATGSETGPATGSASVPAGPDRAVVPAGAESPPF